MLYTLAYMAAAFFGGNAAAIKLICELAALGESPKKGGFVPKFSPGWRFWTLNLSGVTCFGVSCLSLLSIMLTPQANGRQVASAFAVVVTTLIASFILIYHALKPR